MPKVKRIYTNNIGIMLDDRTYKELKSYAKDVQLPLSTAARQLIGRTLGTIPNPHIEPQIKGKP